MESAADRGHPQRWLTVALGVWAVGVQLNELGAAIGAYGTTALVLWQRRPSARQLKRWWPLLAFVAWGLVIPSLAGRPPTGTGLARLSDWLLLPVAATAVTLGARLRPVLVAAFATATVSCLVAGLQHFGLWPPLETFAPLSFTRIPFHRVYEPLTDGRFMAGGLTFHRLKFANVTSLVVLAAAPHFRQARALAVAAWGFIAVAVFPAARAATLSLTAALATLIRPRWLVAMLLAVALVAGVWNRPSGEREVLLRGGWSALRNHPWAGVGVGRFKPGDWVEPGAPPEVAEHPGKAHNQFLTVAAEGGVLHAVLLLVLLVDLARRYLRRAGPARDTGLAALAFFGLLSMLHDPLFHAVTSQALMLTLGACVGHALRENNSGTASAPV